MCFILRLAPCFVATARAVLLSALACVRNDSHISFRMACAKINSADSAPRAYSSDSPLDKATVTCPRHSRQEKLINVTQSARCAFPRHWITSPVSVRITRDVVQGLVQVIRFQCRYRQIEIQFLCSFQISQHFLGTCQICKCWWRKCVWQAFCRKHQIRSHSGNVLQFSNKSSEQWVLNLIAHCRLTVQIQALPFRQRRHHCLCVLQLNSVEAFVHVLGSRFPCEPSAVTIVYTSAVESPVSYRYSWVESFSSLDHDQFCDLRPEFFKCRWLGTNERVVYMGYHTCFVRLMHKQTSLQFATFETRAVWVFQPGILWSLGSLFACRSSHREVSKSIHRVLVLSEVERTFHRMSLLAWEHTQSPFSTRRSNHAAYSNSPRTDNGDGVGAKTSSLTVVLVHISISLHHPSIVEPNLWAESICWEVCQSPWPRSTAADLSSAGILVHHWPWLCQRAVRLSRPLHRSLE